MIIIKPPIGISTGLAYDSLGFPLGSQDLISAPGYSDFSELGALERPTLAKLQAMDIHAYSAEENIKSSETEALTIRDTDGSSGGRSIADFDRNMGILSLFENDFERALRGKVPELDRAWCMFEEVGALKCLLAGSGSSLIGFFFGREAADHAAERLRALAPSGWFLSRAGILF